MTCIADSEITEDYILELMEEYDLTYEEAKMAAQFGV